MKFLCIEMGLETPETRDSNVQPAYPSAFKPLAFHDYKLAKPVHIGLIFQELCESRGGRPGLSVLTSLLVSVDVKNY